MGYTNGKTPRWQDLPPGKIRVLAPPMTFITLWGIERFEQDATGAVTAILTGGKPPLVAHLPRVQLAGVQDLPALADKVRAAAL